MNRLRKNYWNKILPYYLIENVFADRATSEELHIYNSLKHYNENQNRINKVEKEYISSSTNSLVLARREFLKQNKVSNSNFDNSKIKKDNSVKQSPKAGQMWSTKRTSIEIEQNSIIEPVAQVEYIFLLSSPETIKDKFPSEIFLFLPISFATEYATHKDIIINDDYLFNGIKFMVHTSLESSSLVNMLDSYQGTLSNSTLKKLLNMYYFSQNMEWDEDLYFETQKGHLDSKFGKIKLEYQEIQKENFIYLNKPLSLFTFGSEQKEPLSNNLIRFNLPSNNYSQDSTELPYISSRLAADDISTTSREYKFWELEEKTEDSSHSIIEENEIFIKLSTIENNLYLIVYAGVPCALAEVTIVQNNKKIYSEPTKIEIEKPGRTALYFDKNKIESGKAELSLLLNDVIEKRTITFE